MLPAVSYTHLAALEVCGFDKVFAKVGMEPSGDAFNSLVKLDLTSNYPYNPMINSGAIAVASYLMPVVSFEEMLQFSRKLCLDAEIILDEKVFQSEMTHSARNRAIAYLLESKGIIESDVEKSLDLYVKMCSLGAVSYTHLDVYKRQRFGSPNVFMVGDVKQSIYKFRLARPELFLEKYNSYTSEESLYQKDVYKRQR